MTTAAGDSETWQARLPHALGAQLRRDAELLGVHGRSEIVRAALQLWHRRAAQERMARSVDAFYGADDRPLPVGVRYRVLGEARSIGVAGPDPSPEASP